MTLSQNNQLMSWLDLIKIVAFFINSMAQGSILPHVKSSFNESEISIWFRQNKYEDGTYLEVVCFFIDFLR